MATVERRRYRYPDRGAAEAAVKASEQREFLVSMTLTAVLNGSVQWFRGKEIEVGRFGADRIDGGSYIVRHLWPDSPQRPSARVYSPAEIASWRRTLFHPQDDEQRELASLIDKASAHRGGSNVP